MMHFNKALVVGDMYVGSNLDMEGAWKVYVKNQSFNIVKSFITGLTYLQKRGEDKKLG